jgi:hypothetical protein
MTHELPPGAMDEILELIYGGQKIMACKRYMEIRGTSLLEAKKFVEKLTEQLQQESPEKFAKPKPGCFGLFLLVVVSLGYALIGVYL